MASPAKIIHGESADSIAPPPDSGVRESLGRVAVAPALSYRTFTASELESHIVEAQRMAPQPIHVPGWPDLSAAGRDAGRVILAWVRLPKPRPRVMDLCRPELETLGRVVKAVLRAVPWRRLGAATGLVLGCIAALLFAVITVGELTDDVKPGKHLASASSLAVKAPPPVVVATAAPVVPAAADTATFEIVEPVIASPRPPPKAKKKVKKAKHPGAERFVP